jgi:hypothetical protein
MRIGFRAIAIAVIVVLVLLGGLWWRATWVVDHLLHTDAPKAIAEKSGDVYRLDVGRVRFNPLRRRIAVDSVHLSTNDEVNARRPRPRTALRLQFHQCTIAGLHLFAIIAGRGLVAASFGCADVTAAAQVPPPLPVEGNEPDTAIAPSAARQTFYIIQQGMRLPKFAPRLQVARIDFPHAALDLRLSWARKAAARFQLEHLEWHMTDFTVDPKDSLATSRPLFSRTVKVAAESFLARPDSESAVHIAAFTANLPDSSIEIQGIAFAPTISDSAFAWARPYRRSLLKGAVGRIVVRGLEWGALALGEGVRARMLQVDSLRVDVLSDRRRPANPTRRVRRTPQQWFADLERNVSIDSVLLQRSEIAYRERRPRHRKAGVLTFARLNAVAVNVRHAAGPRRAATPVTLGATTYLQNVGRLDARFEVPLDALGFDMRFNGSLGPMPATSLNAFIAETFAVRLAKGQVVGISFDANVRRGVARGVAVPRYKDLSIEVTGRGATGVLGQGGVIGGAAREIATFVGNATELRGDNPADGETEPRRGPINHTFSPDQTLPTFLWVSLRGGLMAVLQK